MPILVIGYHCRKHRADGVRRRNQPLMKDKTMSKHKKTIGHHIDSNLVVAVDEIDRYESLTECIDSYALSVQNSCLADGYSADEAFDAQERFVTKFLCRISFILRD